VKPTLPSLPRLDPTEPLIFQSGPAGFATL